jgi:microcystin degradation protein MlrC
MRIALLGISHETNTFSVTPATYEEFEKRLIIRGDELFSEYDGANYTITGYVDAAKDFDFELVPLVFARTGPIGTITKDAYDRLSSEMFNMLENEGPWDGVLISNHGASVSEEFPDMDGEFTRKTREIVGPKVPVGITFDQHANVSKETIKNTNVCIVWRTTPHLDCKDRGHKCASLIYRTIKGEINPTQFIEMPPMLVNIVKHYTGQEPMKSLVDECVEADENNDEVLDTSIVEGYPCADVEQMGMSWITITDNNPELAEEISKDLAYSAWDKREDLNRPVPSIREALVEAQNIYVGPKPEGEENYVPSDGSALQEAEKTEHSHLGPVVLMDAVDPPPVLSPASISTTGPRCECSVFSASCNAEPSEGT